VENINDRKLNREEKLAKKMEEKQVKDKRK
jgi:hypothetical protein